MYVCVVFILATLVLMKLSAFCVIIQHFGMEQIAFQHALQESQFQMMLLIIAIHAIKHVLHVTSVSTIVLCAEPQESFRMELA